MKNTLSLFVVLFVLLGCQVGEKFKSKGSVANAPMNQGLGPLGPSPDPKPLPEIHGEAVWTEEMNAEVNLDLLCRVSYKVNRRVNPTDTRDNYAWLVRHKVKLYRPVAKRPADESPSDFYARLAKESGIFYVSNEKFHNYQWENIPASEPVFFAVNKTSLERIMWIDRQFRFHRLGN